MCIGDGVINVFHRLWEDGWKQRYYKTKFDVDATDDEFRKKVVKSYVEGLCWVLRYYYQVNHWYTHTPEPEGLWSLELASYYSYFHSIK